MRVAVVNTSPLTMNGARTLEKEGELKKASALYEQLLKKSPSNIAILSRLMILYRKLKQRDKELSSINKAIQVHRQQYISLKKKDGKVSSLSRSLNKLLANKGGGKTEPFVPIEIEKLEKRKTILRAKK